MDAKLANAQALAKKLDNLPDGEPAFPVAIEDMVPLGEPHGFRCTVTGNFMVRYGSGDSTVGPYRAITPPPDSKWAKVDPKSRDEATGDKNKKRGGKDDGKSGTEAEGRKKSKSDKSDDGKQTKKTPKKGAPKKKSGSKTRTKALTLASYRPSRASRRPLKFGLDEQVEGSSTYKVVTERVKVPGRKKAAVKQKNVTKNPQAVEAPLTVKTGGRGGELSGDAPAAKACSGGSNGGCG